MIQPKTFKELFDLVSPNDLYEVLCFSGINDHKDSEHSKIKNELSNKVYDSYHETFEAIYNNKTEYETFESNRLSNLSFKLEQNFYDTIIKCVQDFYYWSHQFEHIHAHIFKRVVNALQIQIEEINKIMENDKRLPLPKESHNLMDLTYYEKIEK